MAFNFGRGNAAVFASAVDLGLLRSVGRREKGAANLRGARRGLESSGAALWLGFAPFKPNKGAKMPHKMHANPRKIEANPATVAPSTGGGA